MDTKLRNNNRKSDKNIYFITLGIILIFYMGVGLFYKPIKTIACEKINNYNELYLKVVWGLGN